MYNRYVPQQDGSYRRNRMPDAQRPEAAPVQKAAPTEVHPTTSPSHEPPGGILYKNSGRPPQRRRNPPTPAEGFLRRLLPADLETEDLLVIILLLLMAGDSEEERSNALLTLALYLFL